MKRRGSAFLIVVCALFAFSLDLSAREDGETTTIEATEERSLSDLKLTVEQSNLYNGVAEKYKTKYPNLAYEVDQLVYQIASANLLPSSKKGQSIRPILIIGPPSIGKTSMIQGVVEDLGESNKLHKVIPKEGEGDIPMMDVVLNERAISRPGVQRIVWVDEIQDASGSDELSPKDLNRQLVQQLDDLKKAVEKSKWNEKMAQPIESELQSMSNNVTNYIHRSEYGTDSPPKSLNRQVLWHLLGNGVVPAGIGLDGNRSTDEGMFRKLLASIEEKARARKDLQEMARAENQEITSWTKQSEWTQQKGGDSHAAVLWNKARDEYTSGSFRINHRDFNRSDIFQRMGAYPHLYRGLLEGKQVGRKKLASVLNDILNDQPEGFAQHVREQIDTHGLDQDIDLSRTIIILSGNHQELLDTAQARAKDPTDPDSLHEAMEQIIREDENDTLVREYLESVLGKNKNTAAFLSRLGKFAPKKNLTSDQVRNLIRSLVQGFSENALRDLQQKGFNLTALEIDDSVIDVLFGKLKSHHLDLRLIVTEVNQQLEILVNKHIDALSGTPLEILETIDKLMISFDRSQQKFKTEAKNGDKTIGSSLNGVKSFPGNVTVAESKSEEEESRNFKRLRATHVAGTQLVGSLIFGSPAKRASIEKGEFLTSQVTDMWNQADLDNLAFKRNLFLVRLAGLAAEREFMEETLISERAQRERSRAESLLDEIKSDIETLKRQQFADGDGSKTRLFQVMPHRYKELVFSNIHKGMSDEEIIRDSISHLQGLLKEHKTSLEQMTRTLLEKDEITPNEVVNVFMANESKAHRNQVRNAKAGSVEDNPCRLYLGKIGMLYRLKRWGRVLRRKMLPW